MKRLIALSICSISFLSAPLLAQAQGTGWSAKKDLLGKVILNEQKRRIGTIDDLLIPPDGGATAIIGAGSYVEMPKHDVAVPLKDLQMRDGSLVFPKGTKEAVKAMPAYEPHK